MNPNPNTIMDYLTAAGYEVIYKLNALRKPLGAEKEYSVSVKLGDEYIEGTSGVSFTVSEERLVLGLFRILKEKLNAEQKQKRAAASDKQSDTKQTSFDEDVEPEG